MQLRGLWPGFAPVLEHAAPSGAACDVNVSSSTIRGNTTVRSCVRIGIRNVPPATDSVPDSAGSEGARNGLSIGLAVDGDMAAIAQRAYDRMRGAGTRTHVQVGATRAHGTACIPAIAVAISARVISLGVVGNGVAIPDDLAH